MPAARGWLGRRRRDLCGSEVATPVRAPVRTFDAIHRASALRIDADQLLAYDSRLLAAATEHGVTVASPRPGSAS